MRRLSIIWLAMTWLVAGMPHALAGHPSAIPGRATLNSITVVDPSVGREVLLQIDGDYSFKTIHTPEGALYVELQGARIGGISPSAHWASGLLAGYQLIEYTDASGEPVVRVEIQTRGPESLIAVQESSGLRLLLAQSAPASGTPTPPAKGAESSPGKPASGTPTPPAKGAESSPGETTEGPALVSDILIGPGSAGGVTIDVATTKPTTFHALQLDHPNRLVVDLEGARDRFRRKSIPVSSPVVQGVRVGQFREKNPEVVRVVADLSGNPVFDAHAYAGGVRIEVKPRPMAASWAVAPAPAPKLQTAAKRDERKPIQQAAVVPARQVPAPPAYAVASAAPEPQTGVIPKRPSAVVSSPARIEKTPKPDSNGTLLASEGNREVAAAPRQTPHAATPEALRAERAAQVLNVETASNLSAAQGTVPAASASPSEQKPAYTGEPISLNLKDVDLKDFFRLIH